MHRKIMGISDPKVKVDHKSHDTLDNRRENLRVCTNAQNARNRRGPSRNSTSGLRGVCWHSVSKKWTAQIQINGKRKRLGLFQTKEAAAAAYAKAARTHYGEFAGSL